jgi:hypothetical protein
MRKKRQFFRRKLAKIAENWQKSQKIVIVTSTPDDKVGLLPGVNDGLE